MAGITTANWWFNGADLRLTDFDVESSFLDPIEADEDGDSAIQKKLEYISFHLGGNHAIGGSKTDLEISLVFASPNGVSSSHGLSIVTVQATSATLSAHRFLAQVLEHIPKEWGNDVAGTGATFNTPKTFRTPYSKGTIIDYRHLLPGRRGYFTYKGSEPSPPCRPARWYVMESPLHISHSQLALLRNRTGAARVPPRADLADELVGNHRPLQAIADESTINIRHFEEIFVDTRYDDTRPSYQGHKNIIAMAVCSIVIGLGVMALAAYIIYLNYQELIKIPSNYGVDKSLMETIQGEGGVGGEGGGGGGNASSGDGGGKHGKPSGLGASKRKSGNKEKYLKGLPGATKSGNASPMGRPQKEGGLQTYD